jgi:hypothetical protein
MYLNVSIPHMAFFNMGYTPNDQQLLVFPPILQFAIWGKRLADFDRTILGYFAL